MQRLLIALVFCMVGLAVAQAPAASGAQVTGSAKWLAGCWGGQMKSGEFEECWTAEKNGHMMGSSRRFKDGKINFMEFMLLERVGDKTVMTVQHFEPQLTQGSKPVSFTLVRATDTEAVFENPAHDHPQRILYRRLPDGSMEAVISMLDGTKSLTFPMKRLGASTTVAKQ